jgi:predicted phosphate transport protein (TIGR00153 family)
MFRGILPKEYAFFDYFDQLISIDKQMSILFLTMVNNEGGRVELSKQIKDLERHADKLSRSCTDLLYKTFITPIDRNDIFTLVKRLDDLADQLNAAAFRMSSYDITDIRYEAVEFATIIQSCIEELIVAVKELRIMKNKNHILDCCKRIHDLENQADEILRGAVSRLFKEGDVLLLIKWKEIFERLEKAVDRCENIASTIEGILIEHS